jgi:hypothetical protein
VTSLLSNLTTGIGYPVSLAPHGLLDAEHQGQAISSLDTVIDFMLGLGLQRHRWYASVPQHGPQEEGEYVSRLL